MDHRNRKSLFALAFFLILLFAKAVFSQGNYKTDTEEANAYNVTRTIKTVEGLNFNTQKDRPIEKVAGVYRPLDIDAYVAMKFNQVDKKVADLKKNVTRQFDDVAGLFQTLTKKVDELTQKVADLEQRESALVQNQTVAVVPEAPAQLPKAAAQAEEKKE